MEATEIRLSKDDIELIAKKVTENLLLRIGDTGLIYDPITIEEAVRLTGLSRQTFYNNMDAFHRSSQGRMTILPKAEVLRFAKNRIPRNNKPTSSTN